MTRRPEIARLDSLLLPVPSTCANVLVVEHPRAAVPATCACVTAIGCPPRMDDQRIRPPQSSAPPREALSTAPVNDARPKLTPKSLPYGDIVNKSYQGLGAQMIPLLEKSLDVPIQLIPTRTPQESRQKLIEKKCDFINLDTPHKDTDDKMTFTSSLLNVPLVVITRDISYVAHFSEIVDKSFVILQDHPMLFSLKEMFPSFKSSHGYFRD